MTQDSEDDSHNEDCLHCALRDRIEEWAASSDRTDSDGMVNINDMMLAAGIGALIADLMAQSPDSDCAGAFLSATMKSAADCYPVYRMHYKQTAMEDILENFEPRGKPS